MPGYVPWEEQGLRSDTESLSPGRAPEQLGDAGSQRATRQRQGDLDSGQPASSGSPWGDEVISRPFAPEPWH